MPSYLLGDFTNDKIGIKENTELQYFEFYVAGYTKLCAGVNVQVNHVNLFNQAAAINKCHVNGAYEWPFGENSKIISVHLYPEQHNSYDPNALIVKATIPMNFEAFLQGQDTSTTIATLGYVPKQISAIVKKNLDRILVGSIKKVRRVHNKRNCSTKVAFPWNIGNVEEEDEFFDRLEVMLDEVESHV